MFDIGTIHDRQHPIERRRFPRRVVRRIAKVLPRFEDDVLDCVIRDQSPAGVRLAVHGRESYPSSLVIGVQGGAKLFEATPMWFERFDVGLRFIRSFELAACSAEVRARLLRLTTC